MPAKDTDRWQQNADGSWSRKIGEYGEQGVDATEGAVEAAAELGVDLSYVTGSGKDGRITKADVEDYAEANAG